MSLSENKEPVNKPLASLLKEKTVKYGVTESDIVGLIATILGGDIPDETVKSLMSKTVRDLSQMTVEEIETFPGIGRTKAVRLTAAFELARRLATLLPEEKPVVKSPNEVAALVMAEMRYLNRENFRILLLSTKNHVIGIETVSVGTLNLSLVHPREVFRNAIKKSANSIIMVHNHPSGDPTPSSDDFSITEQLTKAGAIIGIQVLDHVIIGDGKFISLKERGVI
ncbi:MAG: DNA repair protein RadC [Desulfotomaculaceae bacterium]|nr:DNA repair protein RadC [Desulfotomaculaceae bacterium]